MDPTGLIPSFGGFALTLVAFIVALSIIVAVHEYGHYIVGRWSGIKAEVFSLGFGPVLVSRMDRHGTRWQVAAIPLGGYVKFLGDANAASAAADPETMAHLSTEDRRHTMHGAPLWARAATVAAGPAFNFILSILVFAGIFLVSGFATDSPTVGGLKPLPAQTTEIREGDAILAVNGVPTPDYETLSAVVETLPSAPEVTYLLERDGTQIEVTGPALFPPRVDNVAPGSAAMDIGLERGDVVLTAEGRPVHTFADLQATVKAAQGRAVLMTVWREGLAEPFEVALVARQTDLPLPEGGFETRYLIGVGGSFFFDPATRVPGPVEALTAAADQTWVLVKTQISGLWHMITGAISSCNLRGPIGIAETSGAVASQGLSDFIWFIAVLSTAIGLINLFPIPMLDGGHLVFHAWEWSTGKPPSDRALRVLMTAGLAIVIGLMTFGLTNDLFCP